MAVSGGMLNSSYLCSREVELRDYEFEKNSRTLECFHFFAINQFVNTPIALPWRYCEYSVPTSFRRILRISGARSSWRSSGPKLAAAVQFSMQPQMCHVPAALATTPEDLVPTQSTVSNIFLARVTPIARREIRL